MPSQGGQARLACLGCVLLLSLEVGCGNTAPLVLSPRFTPHAALESTRSQQGTHRWLRVLGVQDLRADKTSLGLVAGRPVRAPEDTQEWLRNVIKGLPAKGIDVTFGDTPTSGTATPVEVELLAAWVSGIATSMTANVAIRLRTHEADGSMREYMYRGNKTALNWSSGDHELQGLMDEAFDAMLTNLALDLTSRPAQGKASNDTR